MDFKILGDITHIETIAAGSGIRELAQLRKRYGRGRWRKRKGMLKCGWVMAQLPRRSFTGTKPPELADANSRLSAFYKGSFSHGKSI